MKSAPLGHGGPELEGGTGGGRAAHLERPRLISYTSTLILGARDKGFPQSNSPQVTILASPVVAGKLWFDGQYSNPELPPKRLTENPNGNIALV